MTCPLQKSVNMSIIIRVLYSKKIIIIDNNSSNNDDKDKWKNFDKRQENVEDIRKQDVYKTKTKTIDEKSNKSLISRIRNKKNTVDNLILEFEACSMWIGFSCDVCKTFQIISGSSYYDNSF